MMILKSDRELEYMRDAGRIAARTREELCKVIKPGVTTAELDRIAEEMICACGAKPSFKGYNGFPGSICTSLNEKVVHGIPGLRKLVSGDIISIDIGAEINGFHGDTAVTVPVEDVEQEVQRLLHVTEAALAAGIAQALVGNRVSDISHAVQTYVEKHGFSVVRDYVGHGIGRKMHEDPQIPNFGSPGRGPRLQPGLTLAIEPMVNMGTPEVDVLMDNWTVVTNDGLPSAHFEHTVAVTDKGPRILTKP